MSNMVSAASLLVVMTTGSTLLLQLTTLAGLYVIEHCSCSTYYSHLPIGMLMIIGYFLPRELCSARYCCRPAATAVGPSGFCDPMRLGDFIDFISVERVKEKTTT